jgi:hypothetical protein
MMQDATNIMCTMVMLSLASFVTLAFYIYSVKLLCSRSFLIELVPEVFERKVLVVLRPQTIQSLLTHC